MERKFIAIRKIVSDYSIDMDIVKELYDFGLIKIYSEEEDCFDCEDVDRLLSMIRLKNDLRINNEGVDIIMDMRNRILKLSEELNYLRAKLKGLEEEHRMHFLEIPKNKGLIIEIDPEED